MKEYIDRIIDKYLLEWKDEEDRKPLLLRGARQVGKSSAVRNLGKQFRYFAELNFEKQKAAKTFFAGDIDARLIANKIANYIGVKVEPGQTLLFLDEIQDCPEAIMALRFFREDFPELHVIAAGSLLEFTLEELPTFGVGRIRSLFMYPMTFDEFLAATGNQGLINMREMCDAQHPLDDAFHQKAIDLFRIYLLVGGMPEAVAKWVETGDFLKCQNVHNDIVLTYEDDFNKYKKRVDPELLRCTLRGVCHQVGEPLTFSQVPGGYRSAQIREALRLLTLAGIICPVVSSAGNGIPLDAEADETRCKYLFLDTGLMLNVLNMDGQSSRQMVELIMAGSPQELVNKGKIVEMLAGLEMMRYKVPTQRHKMYYWEQTGKSVAEVDYLEARDCQVLPIEVKSSTQGGMKSLWMLMRAKHLTVAIRTSLENFGEFEYTDSQDGDAKRHVNIIPLYALSMLGRKQNE